MRLAGASLGCLLSHGRQRALPLMAVKMLAINFDGDVKA
jgi:hypothetical protein